MAGLFPATDYEALSPEILVALFGVAIPVLDRFLDQDQKALNAVTALIGLLFAGIRLAEFWPSVAAGLTRREFAGALVLDAFAVYCQLVVLIVTTLVVLLSIRHLEVEGRRSGAYYTLLMLGTVGLMLLPAATDLMLLFLALELAAACGYLLTVFSRDNRRSYEAGLKFFLLGAFATGLLLYGISLLYGVSAATDLYLIGAYLARGAGGPAAWAGGVLVLTGLLFKAGVVPFHQWVPDACEGAPTSVTAFLATGFVVGAFAVLVRMLFVGLAAWRSAWEPLLVGVAIATLSLGSLAALTQNNLKRFFGYSAISHVGWLLVGLIAASTSAHGATEYSAARDGLESVLIYLLIYAVMTLGALGVVNLMRRKDLVGDEMGDLTGLLERSPGYGWLMLVFLLSLAGIPPTAGFIGKYLVLLSAVETGHRRLALFAIFFATVMAYGYLRIAAIIFARPVPERAPVGRSRASSVALVVAAVLTIIIGVDPQPVIAMAQLAARALL